MVPKIGLLRDIFEFYNENAYRRSSVMGLAVAVSLCQTAFGRRISSYTDLRTNDYNVILAATGSGKEACESTITKILAAADETDSFLLPPDVQSGNGLMKAISHNPCSIWVCDEFGKILQAVLDKKGNKHIKDVGVHLLKLYGKSNGIYGGAAHSDGILRINTRDSRSNFGGSQSTPQSHRDNLKKTDAVTYELNRKKKPTKEGWLF